MVTFEEAKSQVEESRKNAKEYFAKHAPEMQEYLRTITTPLNFRDSVFIYRCLWREQITLEMLSQDVLEEFKETEHYESILRRKNEKNE